MVLETDGAHWRLGSIETPACETDDQTQKRNEEDELDQQTVAAAATTQRKEKRVKIAQQIRKIDTKMDRQSTSERSWAICRDQGRARNGDGRAQDCPGWPPDAKLGHLGPQVGCLGCHVGRLGRQVGSPRWSRRRSEPAKDPLRTRA